MIGIKPEFNNFISCTLAEYLIPFLHNLAILLKCIGIYSKTRDKQYPCLEDIKTLYQPTKRPLYFTDLLLFVNILPAQFCDFLCQKIKNAQLRYS